MPDPAKQNMTIRSPNVNTGRTFRNRARNLGRSALNRVGNTTRRASQELYNLSQRFLAGVRDIRSRMKSPATVSNSSSMLDALNERLAALIASRRGKSGPALSALNIQIAKIQTQIESLTLASQLEQAQAMTTRFMRNTQVIGKGMTPNIARGAAAAGQLAEQFGRINQANRIISQGIEKATGHGAHNTTEYMQHGMQAAATSQSTDPLDVMHAQLKAGAGKLNGNLSRPPNIKG